jgi:ankyrin repeat protein
MESWFRALICLAALGASACQGSRSAGPSDEQEIKSQEELLLDAIRKDDAERVTTLIAHGIDLQEPVGDSREKRTLATAALSAAGTWGSPRAARALLDAGVSPNSSDGDGKGGLSEAAANGHFATLKVIVEANADLGTVQAIWAAEIAASEGRLDMLRLLVDHGLDVNLQPDPEIRTPLLSAAAQGRTDIVRYLLDHGANPQQEVTRRNKDGTVDILTPRSVALDGNYSGVVELLDQFARGKRGSGPGS